MATETTTETKEPASTTTTNGSEPEAKFTQADVDRIVSERLKREGISELRARAAKADLLEQQSKTTEEQTADRLAKMEQAIQSSTVEALRMRIANRYGVSEEDAELFLTATEAEGLEKQAKRLSEKVSDDDKASKRGRNHVPAEGKTPPTPAENQERAFARKIFSADS